MKYVDDYTFRPSTNITAKFIERWYGVRSKAWGRYISSNRKIQLGALIRNTLNKFLIEKYGDEEYMPSQVNLARGSKQRGAPWKSPFSGTLVMTENMHEMLQEVCDETGQSLPELIVNVSEKALKKLKFPDDMPPFETAVRTYMRKRYGLSDGDFEEVIQILKDSSKDYMTWAATVRELRATLGIPANVIEPIAYTFGVRKHKNVFNTNKRHDTGWIDTLAEKFLPKKGKHVIEDLGKHVHWYRRVPESLKQAIDRWLTCEIDWLEHDGPMTVRGVIEEHRSQYFHDKIEGREDDEANRPS